MMRTFLSRASLVMSVVVLGGAVAVSWAQQNQPAQQGQPAQQPAQQQGQGQPGQQGGRGGARRGPVTPMWIFGETPVKRDTTFFYRKAFTIEMDNIEGVKANLWATGDDDVVVHLNGQTAGFNSSWEKPIVQDVSKLLVPGKNVIAVKSRNGEGSGGMILRLIATLPGGRRIDVITDNTWLASPESPDGWNTVAYDDSKWTPAQVVGPHGIQPWGNLPGADGQPIVATAAETLTLPPGFKAELLYSVPKPTQGSWVAMTPDPKGRLIVSDQYGPLYRVTVGKTAEETKVEQLNLPIGNAQGLLWAFDSLYVTVNASDREAQAGNSSGFYRVRDTDGDGELDKVEKLMKFHARDGKGTAGGEHGPHAIRLGPDGKLYVVAGNFTNFPEASKLMSNSPFKNAAEDLLLPRNPDGGGHDPTVMAPAGFIVRTDPDGKEWEVVSAGMRNAYDFAFHPDGEMFLYDSDMEWDTGTPWYRPTRILQAVSGGEHGWRNGTGKWPEYYPDSLPAVVNMGLGSPTGVEFGYGAKFPAKYQRAFFAQDWSYGKVYAVFLRPEGAGYKGTFETFVSGKPFGVSDLCINPADGAMYLMIGGRRTQSGLYRITYTGNESTAPVGPEDNAAAREARALRRQLERFHGRQDSAAVQFALPQLNSPDRYLRFAARVALEWQPVQDWQDAVLDERRPTAAVNGLIGLIRTGDKSLQPKILEALDRLPLKSMSEEQRQEAFRAYQLAFIRMGKPAEEYAKQLGAKLDELYPSASIPVNRELVQLLTYLDVPSVVSKSMKLLAGANTQEDQLHYAFVLRNATKGWTPELRKAYFGWIGHAEKNYRGGASYKRFLIRMREDALKTVSEQERPMVDEVIKSGQAELAIKVTQPRQFVRNWQMQDLAGVNEKAVAGRNFENGKLAYEAVGCASCHRFAGDGGANGPDLTGLGNRFSPNDVLESILFPSKVISDQYQPTEVRTKDKDVLIGTVEKEDDEVLALRTDPLAQEAVMIKKANIASRGPSKVSLMPEGLIDILKEEEVLDLVAYLRSGGNANDAAFKK